jgi:hypothetical protein
LWPTQIQRHTAGLLGPTVKRLAAVVAVASWFLVMPVPAAKAAGPCADLEAQNPAAYDHCLFDHNAHCTWLGTLAVKHSVCTYPDGGADTCDTHLVSLQQVSGVCTYQPPGGQP